MADPGVPSHLQYASETDYTTRLNGFSAFCLVIGSLAVSARCSARYSSGTPFGADDALAVLGFLGLLVTLVAHFIVADANAVSMTAMTAGQLDTAKNAILAINFTYTVTLLGGKLSLLFLYRRIFGMGQLWFRLLWWTGFLATFPVLLVADFVVSGYLVSTGDPQPLTDVSIYGYFGVSLACAVINVLLLVLPIGMVMRLQLNRSKRAGLIFVFSLGSIGSIVSFARAGRTLQSLHGDWDPRYRIYENLMLCAAETTTLILCACLPMVWPMLVRIKDLTVGSLKSVTRASSRDTSETSKRASLRSKEAEDDQIGLKNDVVHYQADYVGGSW